MALFAAFPLQAYEIPPLVISCDEYYTHTEPVGSEGGTLTITRNGSCWTLTAVPNEGYRFLYWSDDHNTNPVRELSDFDISGAGLDLTIEAVFTRCIYTCYSDAEYRISISNPAAPNKYGYIDTVTVDGVQYMEAHAYADYTFAQWADGSYGKN